MFFTHHENLISNSYAVTVRYRTYSSTSYERNVSVFHSDYAHNFGRKLAENARELGVEYDLESIMHYGGYAFSENGQPVITVVKTKVCINILI